jgi:tripartite-type tricarboxylate transporter receptor subunit TctC
MCARGLLHREIIKIMELPEVREKLVALGFETVASTPEEFAARIKLEIPKWGRSFATPISSLNKDAA